MQDGGPLECFPHEGKSLTATLPTFHQLSPEWGPAEPPEFPREAMSADEYKTRLR